jgi:hypothetical protein
MDLLGELESEDELIGIPYEPLLPHTGRRSLQQLVAYAKEIDHAEPRNPYTRRPFQPRQLKKLFRGDYHIWRRTRSARLMIRGLRAVAMRGWLLRHQWMYEEIEAMTSDDDDDDDDSLTDEDIASS